MLVVTRNNLALGIEEIRDQAVIPYGERPAVDRECIDSHAVGVELERQIDLFAEHAFSIEVKLLWKLLTVKDFGGHELMVTR